MLRPSSALRAFAALMSFALELAKDRGPVLDQQVNQLLPVDQTDSREVGLESDVVCFLLEARCRDEGSLPPPNGVA